MLTSAQLAVLKADILADPTLSAFPNNSDGAFAIAAAYNQPASPAYIVWRTDVSTENVRNALVWAEYDTLSVSKQNAFSFLCSNHIINAGLANVRQGIQSIFAGAQQAGNLAALVALAKRQATRAEKLFAVSGDGTSGTPATMGFEGLLTFQDVEQARNLQ